MAKSVRTRRLDLRLSDMDVALLRAAARRQSETASQFVRRIVRLESERILGADARIIVSSEAMTEIQETLTTPPEPNEAWKRAFESRKTIIGS
ncbi:MAG TPA: DUF1778 domain-containing protein [Chloroflexota bacterium]|nr:DUF1778 domain-containing protein [Chloroflexota bacterium]